MARSASYLSHNLCYTTELSSIIRRHRVYMSLWSATIGEILTAKPDNRKEATEYDKLAIGVY